MKPLDTTKGVITRDIYESGHIDSPLICPDKGEAVKLLIIIASAPVHREARLAIRQTWGHFGSRRDIAIAFLVGAAGQSVDDAIVAENYMYNDLIRGRFVDSYNNLTLKTISMLEWTFVNCPKASFILKTDDGEISLF
jgi:Galactosyltransferase